jgi:hypothetical protein
VKFLLSVYADPVATVALDHADFVATVRATGELIDCQALADPSTGAVVRVREGIATVADGPYVPSPVLAAYYLVDCDDRERAIGLAAWVPAARRDVVEVRPVMLAGGVEMTGDGWPA